MFVSLGISNESLITARHNRIGAISLLKSKIMKRSASIYCYSS